MNVINNPSNWSGGSVGTGSMYNGHVNSNPVSALEASPDDNNNLYGLETTGNPPTQNNKRTLALSNGEVIWDLAGNAAEWTDATMAGGQPGTPEQNYVWKDYTAAAMQQNGLPNTSWPQSPLRPIAQGTGGLFSDPFDITEKASIRGSSWSVGQNAGVISLSFLYAPFTPNPNIGFRVAL